MESVPLNPEDLDEDCGSPKGKERKEEKSEKEGK